MMPLPLAFYFCLKRPWLSLRCARLDTFLYRQMASQANRQIDLHALEAKWCNRWHNRATDTRNDRSPASLLPALISFYGPHLRTPSSILVIFEYHHSKTRISGNRDITVIDRVFQLVPTEHSELRQ